MHHNVINMEHVQALVLHYCNYIWNRSGVFCQIRSAKFVAYTNGFPKIAEGITISAWTRGNVTWGALLPCCHTAVIDESLISHDFYLKAFSKKVRFEQSFRIVFTVMCDISTLCN